MKMLITTSTIVYNLLTVCFEYKKIIICAILGQDLKFTNFTNLKKIQLICIQWCMINLSKLVLKLLLKILHADIDIIVKY